MNYLGNIIFNIIFYISVVLASFIIIFLYPLINTVSLQNIASYWVTSILHILKILCGVSWKVTGIENITESPCVLVSNHQGQWESFYLQTLLIPSSSIIKKELLFIPVFGWALACLKPIHLRRSRKYKSMKKLIKDGAKKLKKGTSIIIFPEGTRTDPSDGIKKFTNSCGYLSVNNNVPIIPVCHNSGLYWKNKKFMKHRGEVKVHIGKPIYGNDPKKVTKAAYEWIELKFKEIH